MTQNNFFLLNDIIDKIIRKHKLEKIILEGRTIKEWNEVVGERIAELTKPVKVSDGKLFVQVLSNNWRTELIMLRPEIKKKINEKMGNEFLKDIVFV